MICGELLVVHLVCNQCVRMHRFRQGNSAGVAVSSREPDETAFRARTRLFDQRSEAEARPLGMANQSASNRILRAFHSHWKPFRRQRNQIVEWDLQRI